MVAQLLGCVAPLQGGFSEVQLAQDKLTGKAVALKIIFLNRPGLTAEQVWRQQQHVAKPGTLQAAAATAALCLQEIFSRRTPVLAGCQLHPMPVRKHSMQGSNIAGSAVCGAHASS